MKHRFNFLFGVIMTVIFMMIMGNAHGSNPMPKPVNNCVKFTGKANAKQLKHNNPTRYRLNKRNHKRNRHVRYQTPRAKVHKATFHGDFTCMSCPPKFR